MAKFHVNPNTGNSGTCKSAKGKCPFGSEDEHFSSPEAASAAAEKLMAEQYSAVNTAYRKKDTSALVSMNRELKKRIISESVEGANKLHPSVVAKVFSKDSDELIRKNVSEKFKSQKILREMSTDESARVRLAVAQATNNPAVLKALADDPDTAVRKAAIANKNTPVKARKAALDAIKGSKAVRKTPEASTPATKEKVEPNKVNKYESRSEHAARLEREEMAALDSLDNDMKSQIPYKGELTPSSELRLKLLDEKLQSNDPVIKRLATETRQNLMTRNLKKWSIDEELEMFDKEVGEREDEISARRAA